MRTDFPSFLGPRQRIEVSVRHHLLLIFPNMKVLIITPTSKLGGAERNIGLLARAMPRDRVTLALATTFGTGDLNRIFNGEGLEAEEFHYAENPLRVRDLYRYVARLQPDIIHSWLLRGNWIARGLKIAHPRIPWIAAERGLDITRPPWKARVNRALLASADRILAVSEPVRQILITRDKLDAGRIHVLPGGIPPVEPPLPLPAGTPPLSRPRLVGVGHLRAEKDQALSLHALAHVRQNGIPASLTLFGDGPERPRLDHLVRELGLQEAVHFAGNVLEARRMLSHFDLLVLPSKEEGFPNVILEAWQAGIPAFSTHTPGAAEISGPDRAALLVPAADFAPALLALLRDPGQLADLAARGSTRVLDFSIAKVVADLLGHYEAVRGERRSAR